MMMRTLLLAAGTSRRMGSQKLLLPFGSSTVLGTVISSIRAGGAAPIICAASERTARECADLAADDITIVINHRPEDGMSSSLRLALGALEEGEPFAIMLGDLPMAGAEIISSLKRSFETMSGSTALVPRSGGRLGHPSFFRGAWRDRFMEVRGDRGGREIIEAHADEVEHVDAPRECFADLDTPEQYSSALKEEIDLGKEQG